MCQFLSSRFISLFFIVYFLLLKNKLLTYHLYVIFYWFKNVLKKLQWFLDQSFTIFLSFQDTYKTMVKFPRHIKNMMMERHFEWITCFFFLLLFLIHLLTHKQNALPEPKKRTRQRITKFLIKKCLDKEYCYELIFHELLLLSYLTVKRKLKLL